MEQVLTVTPAQHGRFVSAHAYDGATAMREVISAIAGTRENT
jgi:hypothetical protein